MSASFPSLEDNSATTMPHVSSKTPLQWCKGQAASRAFSQEHPLVKRFDVSQQSYRFKGQTCLSWQTMSKALIKSTGGSRDSMSQKSKLSICCMRMTWLSSRRTVCRCKQFFNCIPSVARLGHVDEHLKGDKKEKTKIYAMIRPNTALGQYQ